MRKLSILLLSVFILSGCESSLQSIELGAVSDISADKVLEKYNLASEIKDKYVLEGSALIKTEIKNPELDKYKNEPKDEIEVTIGEKPIVGQFGAVQDFTPDIELRRWNEVGFKLKPKGLENIATKDKTLKFEGNKIRFDTPKISFEMYDVPATATDEGSYKYIWYLNEKPLTNKVEFQIETQGLDFCYQPRIDAGQVAEEKSIALGVSPKWCDSSWVNQFYNSDDRKEGYTATSSPDAFRPENVVGSYAVYHSTKGGLNDINGKEYKVGKAFHIFRPHIIDAEGKETWGNLHIENGIYLVEIPQEFLDKAVYPIKSNDTFGNTTLQATDSSISSDIIRQRVGNPGQNGTVTSISWGVFRTSGTANINIQLALYTSAEALISPQSNTGVISDNIREFKTLPVTSTLNVSNQNYYITGFIDYNAGDIQKYAYDTGGVSGDSRINSGAVTWNTWPDPLSKTDSSSIYSIYATYTPSGGGPSANVGCFHLGGDWYIDQTCWISSNTTTNGFIYLDEAGQLNCIDNAVIQAKGIKGKSGTKINGKTGCKMQFWPIN